MRIYDRNFLELSKDEKEYIEKRVLKKRDIRSIVEQSTNERMTIEQPKFYRHHNRFFPNNYLDPVDFRSDYKLFKNKVHQFDTLIHNTKCIERDILNYIRDARSYFIIGSILVDNFRFGHHETFVFPEFPLGTSHVADFLLIGKSSDGYSFVFVELESPYGNITLKDGSLGNVFRKGISQIDDWEGWLESNFSNLEIEFSKYLSPNLVLPNEFRKFDKSRIHFAVVAGLRKNFNDKTYHIKRRKMKERSLYLFHYENLIEYSSNLINGLTY